MNIGMNHAPDAGSITQPVDLQSSTIPLCCGCPHLSSKSGVITAKYQNFIGHVLISKVSSVINKNYELPVFHNDQTFFKTFLTFLVSNVYLSVHCLGLHLNLSSCGCYFLHLRPLARRSSTSSWSQMIKQNRSFLLWYDHRHFNSNYSKSPWGILLLTYGALGGFELSTPSQYNLSQQ